MCVCGGGEGGVIVLLMYLAVVSCLCLCFCFPSFPHAATAYTILVNNNEIRDANGLFGVGRLQSITVTCCLDRVDPLAKIVLERIVNGETSTLNNRTTNSFTGSSTLWTYPLNYTEIRIPVSTYRCRDKANVNCPDYVQVTLYSTTQKPPRGATIPDCPPGGSSSPPPSSDPASTPSSSELGLVGMVVHECVCLNLIN